MTIHVTVTEHEKHMANVKASVELHRQFNLQVCPVCKSANHRDKTRCYWCKSILLGNK